MATFALGTLLKVGVAVAATGVSIATPILLHKNGVFSTSSSSEGKQAVPENVESVESEVVPSLTGDSQSQQNTELQGQETSQTETSLSNSGAEDSSFAPSTTQEELNKDCFIIPVTSDNGSKLLACLGEASDRDENETYSEYNSLYYLNTPKKENLLLGEKDKLMWNPSKRQISVNLEEKDATRKSMNNSVFEAEGDEWNDVLDGEFDLKGQCSIFKNDSLVSLNNKSYLWVCGNHLSDFSDSNPKGIPLTPWPKTK